MGLCIATALVAGDLKSKFASIAQAGFAEVELHEPDLDGYAGTPAEVCEMAQDLGLEIKVLRPFEGFEGLSGKQREKALELLEKKLELTAQLGAATLLVETCTHPEASGDEDAIIADLAELGRRTGDHGVKVALLALPWARHVKSALDALKLIRQANSPHLGLALNSFFTMADGTKPARLRDISGDLLFHVQLTDAPKLDLDTHDMQSHVGLLPGQGRLNLESFVRVVAKSGYNGAWSLAGVSYAKPGVGEISECDGYCALVNLLDEVARTEPALQAPVAGLPQRVYPLGFEFIEFAVNAKTGAELEKRLTAMCFRKERQHISKNVELWRQGAVNIVVNKESKGYAAKEFREHGPSVCDMGLRVKDAAQTIDRATHLGTEKFSQAVGMGELEIPAIKTAGESVFYFIDEKSDLHRMWDIDFDAVPKAETIPPAGLRRIDHVVQTMQYQEMQSWLTYYTSTFEMEKSAMVDVVDPSGKVWSQAIASPAGEVRIALNGAVGNQTFAGSFLADHCGSGVQHIAFATDDIFETSARLASEGFDRQEMTADYYKDLQERFELDDALIARMKEENIMYDSDGKAEFFQIFSVPIFNGFFFEVVERRRGYMGYGARNASYRLAAQKNYLQAGQKT